MTSSPSRSWALCWDAALRSRPQPTNASALSPFPDDGACPCPSLPPPLCRPRPPLWRPAMPRLLVAISVHVTDSSGWLLLRRAVCSVFTHHPNASVLLVDQASPHPFAARIVCLAFARLSICRHAAASRWAYGAIELAHSWAEAHNATHVAYLQHTMALRRPFPLGGLGTSALLTHPNCSFVSFQVFRGQNYDSEERMKHFVLKAWVDREWNVRLHQPTPKKYFGVYSHGFVATRGALDTMRGIGLFNIKICSKFQDEGTERMLGMAAEGPLNSPQASCNLDGSLFHPQHDVEKEMSSLYVEKVSHLIPSNFVMKAGASTVTYSQLNQSRITDIIAHQCPSLASTCNAHTADK
ncbi:hypothetical protein AB1Y20_021451 [Prymnesium parvum]|uniref:Uncharacterized protein n=1 Tax=Prymnesium parvum TaxID=97485 RepID=A0AB34JLK8_PRYPA